MAIVVRLDRVMADRKVSSTALAEKIGLNAVSLSKIKTGKIKSIRFTTLEAICKELECQPGDLMEYLADEEYRELFENHCNPVSLT